MPFHRFFSISGSVKDESRAPVFLSGIRKSTVWVGFGGIITLTHDFVFGYSDDETVMLDMDNTDLKTVEKWAKMALRWYELGGYLILESSPDSFHVVFDRVVDWSENMRIVAWVALLSGKSLPTL